MKVEITDEAADKVIADTCREILSEDSWCWGLDANERAEVQKAAKVFLAYFGVGDD